jgi:glycosyltransferase involved in cell wall biosynthesis
VRILYVASDVALSDAHGGAVHVREVASGLAALGHEVWVIVRGRPGQDMRGREDGFEIRRVLQRVPSRIFRLIALPAVDREARELRPDVVIERYYNFGGEGVIVARRLSVPALLEVNSPMVEYPGSLKDRLDRLVGSPLRRWREYLAREAAGFVAPTATILPAFVEHERVHELPWGANTERFHPGVPAANLAFVRGRKVVAFVSSFRSWHGASSLVEAAAKLRRNDVLFLMIGDGPERAGVESRIAALGLARSFVFTGAIPHENVPSYLRHAFVGVAPFETRRHRYLEIDFYWSPLKILEYMAMALPVVTVDLPALRRIVRPGVDGLVYPEGDIAALAAALAELLDSPEKARSFGHFARERVVEDFSWRRHCTVLDTILRQLAAPA